MIFLPFLLLWNWKFWDFYKPVNNVSWPWISSKPSSLAWTILIFKCQLCIKKLLLINCWRHSAQCHCMTMNYVNWHYSIFINKCLCIFCCRCWIFPLMQICLFSLFCYLTSSWLLQCYFFTSNDFYQTKLSLMITNIILVITSSHVIHSLYYIFKNWFTSIKKYFCFHCWLKQKLPRQMLYGNWTVFGMPKCTIDIRNLFPVQYSPHTKTSLPALRVLAQYTFH